MPEECDGEDNDGNRLVDEHGNQLWVGAVPVAQNGTAVRNWRAFATRESLHLAVWDEEVNRPESQLRYQLFDAALRPVGPVRSLAPTAIFLEHVSAVPFSGGFYVAYVELEDFFPVLKIAEIDPAGNTSLPLELARMERIAQIELFYDGAPVVVIRHDCEGSTCQVSLARSGAPLVPVDGSDASEAVRPAAGAALSDGTLAVGWIECPQAQPGDGGPPSRELCSGVDATARPRASVRIFGTGPPVSFQVPGAYALSMIWQSETLLVAWLDLSDGQRPRLALSRFDRTGQHLGEVEVSAEVNELERIFMVLGQEEVGVHWTTIPALSTEREHFFARVHPELGPIGSVARVTGGVGALGGYHAPDGYGWWLWGPSFSNDRAVSVARLGCRESPSGVIDGGALPDSGGVGDGGTVDGGAGDGGAGDGGAEDGGTPLPDGGSLGLCSPPDGGAGVSGRVRLPGGTPLAGVAVVLRDCFTTTDTEGLFEAGDVAFPYDLGLVVAGAGPASAFSLTNLTATSTVVELPRIPVTVRSATLAITADRPLPIGADVHAFLPGRVTSRQLPPGTFGEVSVGWLGYDSTAAQLLYLEKNDAGEFVRGQHIDSLPLEDDKTTAITLSPHAIGTRVLFGAVPGVLENMDAIYELGGERGILSRGVVSSLGGNSSYLLETPSLGSEIPGEMFLLAVFAGGVAVASEPIVDGQEPVFGATPDPIVVRAPAEGAEGLGPQPCFDFEPVAGARYYGIRVVGLDFSLSLYTAAPPVCLQDLSAAGVRLEVGTSYFWQVVAYVVSRDFEDLSQGTRLPSILSPDLGSGESASGSGVIRFYP